MDLGGLLASGVVSLIVAAATSFSFNKRAELRTARRDQTLKRLSDTRLAMIANLDYMLRRRANRETGPTIDYPAHAMTPYDEVGLIGDQAALDRIALWSIGVGLVSDGSALTPAEHQELMDARAEVIHALDEQVERAMRYRPLLPSADWEVAVDKAWAWVREHPDGRRRQDLYGS